MTSKPLAGHFLVDLSFKTAFAYEPCGDEPAPRYQVVSLSSPDCFVVVGNTPWQVKGHCPIAFMEAATRRIFPSSPLADPTTELRTFLVRLNEELLPLSGLELAPGFDGSTDERAEWELGGALGCVVAQSGRVFTAHAGVFRIARIRSGEVAILAREFTLAAEQGRPGGHPLENAVTFGLGTCHQEVPSAAVAEQHVLPGDRIVLGPASAFGVIGRLALEATGNCVGEAAKSLLQHARRECKVRRQLLSIGVAVLDARAG